MISRRAIWPWALAVFLLQIGFWPGLVEPGRAFRQVLVLLCTALLATRLWQLRDGLRLGWLPAAAITLLVTITGAHLPAASAAERVSVSFDAAQLAVPWLLAAAAASGPVSRQRTGGLDRALAWGACAALLVAVPLGLAEAWLGWEGLASAHPPAGPFVNRNVAAQALVLLVPLTVAGAFGARGMGTRWLMILAAGGGGMFLVATRSRGGWVAAAAGWGLAAACGGWVSRRELWRTRRAWAGPAAALAAMIVAAALIPVGGSEPLPDVGRVVGMTLRPVEGGSVETRRALWRNTAEIVWDHPWWGVGSGRFPVVFPLYQRRAVPTPGFGLDKQPHHAHDDFLEFAAELGIPALAGVLLLILGALWRSLRDARQGGSAAVWPVSRLALLTGGCLHALVSFPLHSPASAALFWIVIGRAWQDGTPAIEIGGQGGRRAVRLGAGLVTGLAVWAGIVGIDYLSAQRRLGAAVAALQREDCSAALPLAREAAATFSHREISGLAAAIVWHCDRDPGSSLELLEPALSSYPHRLELLLDTGSRRLKRGDAPGAEALYRHALEIKPDLGRAWLGLAMTLDAQGDVAGAAGACRRAIALTDLPAARAYCGGRVVSGGDAGVR